MGTRTEESRVIIGDEQEGEEDEELEIIGTSIEFTPTLITIKSAQDTKTNENQPKRVPNEVTEENSVQTLQSRFSSDAPGQSVDVQLNAEKSKEPKNNREKSFQKPTPPMPNSKQTTALPSSKSVKINSTKDSDPKTKQSTEIPQKDDVKEPPNEKTKR